MSAARPIVILMLEDDDDDFLLAVEGVKHEKLANLIYRVTNGAEGLAYLEQKPGGMADLAGDGGDAKVPFEKCPRPDVVLADLKMPVMGGLEFIARMKANPQFRRIPVVVLTNSRDEVEVGEAYDVGAAAFVEKPISVAEMGYVVKEIRDFFLSVVRLSDRDGER